MRSQAEARSDALTAAVELIDALQDADAPDDLIQQAEEHHSDVKEWVTD